MGTDDKSNKILIEIQPIGEIDKEVLDHIVAIVQQGFSLPVEINLALVSPARAFNHARRQYDASAILDNMRASISSKTKKTLAVIDADIFSKGLNYVFGQAVLGGCCGIISLTRLRQGIDGPGGKELFFERVEKEATHELGHAFGLRHCPNPKCVMYFSNSIADTDRKSTEFCKECGFPLI